MQIGEIREIRNHSPVLSMDAGHPLDAAIQEMCMNNHRVVAVMEDGQLAGIVTEHDLLQKILGGRENTETLRLRDIMTRDIEVARLDDELTDGLKKMKNGHYHHLPVVDDEGHVVAMMKQSDFVPVDATKTLHLARETTTKAFYDRFQPWLMTAGIVVYFIVTTAAIIAYFGL